MPDPKPSLSATVPDQRDETDLDELTDAQAEFMEDLRVSLIQMKNGDVMPAREALRQIRLELETEQDGNHPDG
ncbi:MAG: hypothetical protein OXI30_14065 [Chloroflexota bacterium]|nr:hypothetical protein [Chloroflexota bacterium]